MFVLKMAQVMIDNNLKNLMNKNDFEAHRISIDEKKYIKLYYSNVYKEKVIAFCGSSGKNYILNKNAWEKISKHFPYIEQYFQQK